MFSNLQNLPASLNDFSSYLLDEHGLKISKQAIDYRFNAEAVDFLKGILSLEMKNSVDLSKLNELNLPFKSVRIKDSSRWNLLENCAVKYKGHGGCRANSDSMISVQYDYDLLHGRVLDLSMTSGTRNDLADSKQVVDNIVTDELLIRDLGYVSNSYLRNIVDRQAFFLNRLPPQLGIYSTDDQSSISFKAVGKHFSRKKADFLDMDVLLCRNEKIEARLIVFKVPDQVYQQRIARAKKTAKKRGHQLSDEYKARAAYSSFITNVKREVMGTQTVAKLYRIRWQIELKFKVWKSLTRVNKLSSMKIERFEAQLLAKFIWLLINWKIFFVLNHWFYHQNREQTCSIWKFYKQMLRKPLELRNILQKLKLRKIEKWLSKLFEKAQKNLVNEKRKGKVPLYQLVNSITKLA